MKKVLIIGGVAGGASAAARLRRLNESAEIVLLERGPYISFANCGLPYHVGGVIPERESLLVQTAEGMSQRFRIDVRVRHEAIAIDPDTRSVTVRNLTNGSIYRESYDKLIYAPGSSPIKPPIPGIDSPNIHTIWSIPDMDEIIAQIRNVRPNNAIVVGGGFIGIEMAENLKELGISVQVVDNADQVLGPLDFEMAQVVHKHLSEKGVSLILGDGVDSFVYSEHNKQTTVRLKSGRELHGDLVILAIGVRPNSELAKAAGLTLNPRGGVVTDEWMRTSNPDIYAVGDVAEVTDFIFGGKTMIPLAGPANKQGRIAADNIAAELSGAPLASTFAGSQGTSVVKVFDLTIATTGANEKTLERNGMVYGTDYYVALLHPASHAGYYPGASPIDMKLLFDKTGKILGAQAIGMEGVEKRIDVIATAIRMRGNVSDLTQLELAYAPPYSSAKDPVNMAGFVAENTLSGFMRPYRWQQLATRSDDEIVIDVRSEMEREMGSIPGSIHMPVDTMRERLGELDPNKHYIVHCAVGIRGLAAVRILMQNGFARVSNLLGGYNTYAVVTKDYTDRGK